MSSQDMYDATLVATPPPEEQDPPLAQKEATEPTAVAGPIRPKKKNRKEKAQDMRAGCEAVASLAVNVQCARNVAPRVAGHKNRNLFAVVNVEDQRWRTHTAKQTLNPEWSSSIQAHAKLAGTASQVDLVLHLDQEEATKVGAYLVYVSRTSCRLICTVTYNHTNLPAAYLPTGERD